MIIDLSQLTTHNSKTPGYDITGVEKIESAAEAKAAMSKIRREGDRQNHTVTPEPPSDGRRGSRNRGTAEHGDAGTRGPGTRRTETATQDRCRVQLGARAQMHRRGSSLSSLVRRTAARLPTFITLIMPPGPWHSCTCRARDKRPGTGRSARRSRCRCPCRGHCRCRGGTWCPGD